MIQHISAKLLVWKGSHPFLQKEINLVTEACEKAIDVVDFGGSSSRSSRTLARRLNVFGYASRTMYKKIGDDEKPVERKKQRFYAYINIELYVETLENFNIRRLKKYREQIRCFLNEHPKEFFRDITIGLKIYQCIYSGDFPIKQRSRPIDFRTFQKLIGVGL